MILFFKYKLVFNEYNKIFGVGNIFWNKKYSKNSTNANKEEIGVYGYFLSIYLSSIYSGKYNDIYK
jgi:hypothetical protein